MASKRNCADMPVKTLKGRKGYCARPASRCVWKTISAKKSSKLWACLDKAEPGEGGRPCCWQQPAVGVRPEVGTWRAWHQQGLTIIPRDRPDINKDFSSSRVASLWHTVPLPFPPPRGDTLHAPPVAVNWFFLSLTACNEGSFVPLHCLSLAVETPSSVCSLRMLMLCLPVWHAGKPRFVVLWPAPAFPFPFPLQQVNFCAGKIVGDCFLLTSYRLWARMARPSNFRTERSRLGRFFFLFFFRGGEADSLCLAASLGIAKYFILYFACARNCKRFRLVCGASYRLCLTSRSLSWCRYQDSRRHKYDSWCLSGVRRKKNEHFGSTEGMVREVQSPYSWSHYLALLALLACRYIHTFSSTVPPLPDFA